MAYSLSDLYRAALTGKGLGDIDFGDDNSASILTNILNNQAQISATNLTNAANLAINRETNQTNRELAQQQQDFDYRMWNETNEYNSPEHQVELFKAAGINPLSAYGQIVGNSSASNLVSPDLANQQAVAMQAPQLQAPSIFPETPWMLEAFKGISQVSKDFADTMYKFDELSNTKSGTASQNAYNYAKANEARTQNQLMQYNLSNTLPQQLNNSIADMNKTYAEIERMKKEGKNIDALTDVYNEQRKKVYNETQFTIKQIDYYKDEFNLRKRGVAAQERTAAAAESSAEAAHLNASNSWSGLASSLLHDTGAYNLTVDFLKGIVEQYTRGSKRDPSFGFMIADYLGKRIDKEYREDGDIGVLSSMLSSVAGVLSTSKTEFYETLDERVRYYHSLNGNLPVQNPSGQ